MRKKGAPRPPIFTSLAYLGPNKPRTTLKSFVVVSMPPVPFPQPHPHALGKGEK